MPRYNLKILKRVTPQSFYRKLGAIDEYRYKVFCLLLYKLGSRVSEILNLKREHVSWDAQAVYIEVHRLKGSSQKNNRLPIRNNQRSWDIINYCSYISEGKLFRFSRKTGYNVTRRYFDVYPHFFRMNRLTFFLDKYGLSFVKQWFGIDAKSVDHYVAEQNIMTMGMGNE